MLVTGQRKTCHGGTKMKILLVDPPFYRFIKYYNRYFPLGLAYLAAVLRDNGHQVLKYDGDANVEKAMEMDFSALEEKYPEFNYEKIGQIIRQMLQEEGVKVNVGSLSLWK